MIEIGIVGGTGYTGVELLRLLAQHPQANVRLITSRTEAGVSVGAMFPSLRGLGRLSDLSFTDPAGSDLKACHVVFFATPHGVAMGQARELVGAGVKIIDLAADFRLKDPSLFERWYKMPHACPDLLAESVYGLPEMYRDAIRKARIVGNPGCYPTAIQLGFLPLVEAGIVDPAHLIADAK
ncbi:MAG TPA: N-acetyl-gamma-glutamyl-phosphate reductase, partial [Bradyrhizobium sp.]|nr:N-acetyl-gamma-glutamyl-phosphate reductase [Bradyrhizobium sp.]